MHTIDFSNHAISRIIKGNWQLAGGHGTIDQQQAMDDLFAYVAHGVTTFDVGDIYTGVEEIVGEFLTRYRAQEGDDKADILRVHTKFVPDLDALDDLTMADVRRVIERSIKRLNVKKLHLVQFHWWDYSKGDFVQAARYLQELQDEGLIEAIGLTNFDCVHTQKLLDAHIPIVSNQIQFSLIDPRPLNGILEFAQKNDIAIFCYGTLAGGLLAGARPGEDPTNRSHIKYRLMIDEVGEQYYNDTLAQLAIIANKHQTSIGNIAAAYILQTPGVSCAIIGPRNSAHLSEVDDLFDLQLTTAEYSTLARHHKALTINNHDDVYSYERDATGPHGRIMKYNNNDLRLNQKEQS